MALLASISRWLFLAAALAAPKAFSQSREYQLKAAFVFNFAQFVQWPTNSFAATNSPLVIGILGADPFGPVIDELTRGEFVGTHPMEVRRFSRAREASDCHILFISAAEEDRLQTILGAVGSRPVLTVSDLPDFAERGGMIGLYTAGNKVRFMINHGAAKKAGLEFSSKLLRLAELVETRERR